MEVGARMPRSTEPKWLLCSRPPVGPVARPRYWRKISSGVTPRTNMDPRLRIIGRDHVVGPSAMAVAQAVASWPRLR